MPYNEYQSWVAYILKEPTDGVLQARYQGDLQALHRNLNRSENAKIVDAVDIYPWACYELPDYMKTEEELQIEIDKQNEEAKQQMLLLLKQ